MESDQMATHSATTITPVKIDEYYSRVLKYVEELREKLRAGYTLGSDVEAPEPVLERVSVTVHDGYESAGLHFIWTEPWARVEMYFHVE